MIRVRTVDDGDPFRFDVTVQEGRGETRHEVTMSRATFEKLTGEKLTGEKLTGEKLTGGRQTPEQCIKAAFLFLLDREPKESILRNFDVTVIARYFPEFPRELPRYLAR